MNQTKTTNVEYRQVGFTKQYSSVVAQALSRAEALPDQNAVLGLLEYEGEVAGFCLFSAENGVGRLQYLYIAPEYQGDCIHRLLLKQVMGSLEDDGVNILDIREFQSNVTSALEPIF